MGSYTYATALGIVVPDTSETLATVSQEFKDALQAQDLSTDPDTPEGALIVAEVSSRDSVARNNAFVATQMNPNYSSARWLDATCSWLGLERQPAIRTIVNGVILTGTAGTIVPQGSRAQTAVGDIFQTMVGVQLSTPAGVATVSFESVEVGPVPTAAGSFEAPVDMVLGWETVANPTAGTLGAIEQSDTSLRRQRNETLALQGISTPEAQLSAVRALPNVTGAVFRENYTNVDATIDGIFLVEKSVWLCVDGGTDADVAAAMLENKTAGANWNGAITVNTIEPTSGQSYPVKFDRAEHVPVYVRVTLRSGSDTSDPTVSVPLAVYNWARGEVPNEEGLQVGTQVSPFEVSNGVNYYHPGFQIVKVETRLATGSFSTAELPMTLKQRAIVELAYVSVVVVP